MLLGDKPGWVKAASAPRLLWVSTAGSSSEPLWCISHLSYMCAMYLVILGGSGGLSLSAVPQVFGLLFKNTSRHAAWWWAYLELFWRFPSRVHHLSGIFWLPGPLLCGLLVRKLWFLLPPLLCASSDCRCSWGQVVGIQRIKRLGQFAPTFWGLSLTWSEKRFSYWRVLDSCATLGLCLWLPLPSDLMDEIGE